MAVDRNARQSTVAATAAGARRSQPQREPRRIAGGSRLLVLKLTFHSPMRQLRLLSVHAQRRREIKSGTRNGV